MNPLRWLKATSREIRAYLKGRIVHQSGGWRSKRPGVTFIRPGRAERKERRRQLREVNRWLGTKPGQRGENPPGTGRRQKHKRPPHSRARANARRNARRAAARRGTA